MRRLLLPLFLLLSGASCIRPSGNAPILCGETLPPCPMPMICAGGFCTGADSLLDGGASDASAQADLLTAADQGTAAGCASGGGTPLGPRAVACPGTFTAGQARGRCASGWTVCTQAASINMTDAAALTGFFAADQPAYWAGNMTLEMCGGSLGNQLFYGLGTGRAGTAKCAGFTKVKDVGMGMGWTSTNGTIDQAANTNQTDGVLCCR